MKTATIIAEYNPFHNGHKHQIDYIRNNTDADFVIVVMSGDFTQRGEPAVYSKEVRARMALMSGADAVFLLPVPYSTAGAELFALGGVSIAERLGSDYLCFGSESGNIDELLSAAIKLRISGSADSEQIKKLMWEGNTFARARALAFPEFESLLSKPNNILGIEYIIAGLGIGAKLKYITLPREGSYDEEKITDSPFQSALAIRNLINSGDTAEISKFVPAGTAELIRDKSNPPVSLNDFSDILYTKLLFLQDGAEYFEISDSLFNRIKGNVGEYRDIADFADIIKAKNLTHNGVKRALLHILLDLKKKADFYKGVSELTHVRMLGFKEASGELLRHISENGTIKPVTGVPGCEDSFNDFTKEIFAEDLNASTLYEYIKCKKLDIKPTHDYSKPVIKI